MTAVRPRASLVRVIDGDTYVLAVDVWNAGGSFELAPRARIRLRDYSARERTDAREKDPKGLGRTPGPVAKSAATDLLEAADRIEIEPKGYDPHGRLVAWVWVDEASLGLSLAAEHHVALLDTRG